MCKPYHTETIEETSWSFKMSKTCRNASPITFQYVNTHTCAVYHHLVGILVYNVPIV